MICPAAPRHTNAGFWGAKKNTMIHETLESARLTHERCAAIIERLQWRANALQSERETHATMTRMFGRGKWDDRLAKVSRESRKMSALLMHAYSEKVNQLTL
jgi:hypothetical protein